jgi:uncharacterized protein
VYTGFIARIDAINRKYEDSSKGDKMSMLLCRFGKVITMLTVMWMSATSAYAQLPIIDMHVHAQDGGGAPEDRYGNKRSPNTEHLFKETYKRFRKYNIVKAVVSGDLYNMDLWKSKDEDDRIIRGIFMNKPGWDAPGHPDPEEISPERFESLVKAGRIEVFGELGCIYGGNTLSDPGWQPYLKICEQYDIPVCVHTGAGGEDVWKYVPEYRCSLGDPYLIEDALVRHPRLRVYMAHAGQEWYERAVMLMRIHPNLYTDLGVVLWWSPLRKGYGTRFLRRAKEAGILDRVMFGSDQMSHPHGIEMSIEYLNSLEFLTEKEKRDILYHNAARFLRLEQ